MTDEEKDDLALFKYSLIAPVVAGTYREGSKAAYFRAVAEMEHTLPDGRKVRFSPETLKKWYHKYTHGKLLSLRKQSRSDQGQSRALSESVCRRIMEYMESYPYITGVGIRKKLIEEGYIKPEDASLDAIYRFLRANNLTRTRIEPEEVFSVDVEYANDCWQVEMADGPLIKVGGMRIQTTLIIFSDMISGLITHGELYFSNSYLNLQDAFMKAISKYGLPRWYYDTGGSSNWSRQMSTICAELGIGEIHSRPKMFKGVEEGNSQTCKQRWTDVSGWDRFDNLEALNRSYQDYLDREYNNYPRPTIGMTPKERYLLDYDRIRFVDIETLEEAFLQRAMRKVSRTARINLFRNEYETAQELIGRTVQVRYKAGDISKIYIYDSSTGKRIGIAHPVRNHI